MRIKRKIIDRMGWHIPARHQNHMGSFRPVGGAKSEFANDEGDYMFGIEATRLSGCQFVPAIRPRRSVPTEICKNVLRLKLAEYKRIKGGYYRERSKRLLAT